MPTPTTLTYSKYIEEGYHRYASKEFTTRRFTQEILYSIIDGFNKTSPGFLNQQTAGKSFEGRDIRLLSVGSGKIRILLWSQMHGDESTATMAISDILNYLAQTKYEEFTGKILSSLHLTFLPMLNPDGASRFERRTAQGIDMNRDALALHTPEARILKELQQTLNPDFGFNLHDQELSTVGATKNFTVIALLAPAINPEKTDNAVRTRAKKVAAVFSAAMQQSISENLARYDDTFEPRAFGDNMQKWGTSTILVESGHMPNDPEKHLVRKLNFVGLLTSLYSIAIGEYSLFDTQLYESLPINSKNAYDLIIHNILIDHGNGVLSPADLGISYQVDTHTELNPILADLGDLQTFVGLREIDGGEKLIPHASLSIGKNFYWESFFPS